MKSPMRQVDRSRAGRLRRGPRLERLESREVLAPSGFTAVVRPHFLPTNGRLVPIVINGTVNVNTLGDTPNVNYQVFDEYRLVQPVGSIPLRPVEGTPGQFTFSTRISLRGQVNSRDKSGRQYFVVVAAGDPKGSTGQVFSVVVPNPASPPARPRPGVARSRPAPSRR